MLVFRKDGEASKDVGLDDPQSNQTLDDVDDNNNLPTTGTSRPPDSQLPDSSVGFWTLSTPIFLDRSLEMFHMLATWREVNLSPKSWNFIHTKQLGMDADRL